MQWNDLSLIELHDYSPILTAEKDFDEFWQARIHESNNQPLNVISEQVDYPVPNIKVTRLSFSGFRNSRIYGTLIEPKNTTAIHQIAVQFHGYNWNSAQVHYGFSHVLAGRACLLLEVRAQDLSSADLNTYEHGAAAGWLTKGILNAETAYFTSVYMDGYRAVDALIEHYQTPDLTIVSEGISQGGGLALALAALHKNVAVVAADVPFLSHFKRSVEIATNGPYAEISHFFKIQDPLHKLEDLVYKSLSYIDVMNHAARITIPAIVSVGLEDDVCPPSSVFAAFNHLAGEKQIRVYPDYAHGGFSRQEEEKIVFYQRVLNA